MTAGPRGPLLVQDVVFTDEMAHFDRERIPERVVHAKGAGESSVYLLQKDCFIALGLKIISQKAGALLIEGPKSPFLGERKTRPSAEELEMK